MAWRRCASGVGGHAAPTLPALIATRRLPIGHIVGPGDLREVRLRAERVRSGSAELPDQVIGRQLHRPLAADAVFLTADLGPPTLSSGTRW